MDADWVPVAEAARIVGVPTGTVSQWAVGGKLHRRKRGWRFVVNVAAVRELAAKRNPKVCGPHTRREDDPEGIAERAERIKAEGLAATVAPARPDPVPVFDDDGLLTAADLAVIAARRERLERLRRAE